MEKQRLVTNLLYQTRVQELEQITTCRIGWIKKIDLETKSVWVDYEQNPSQRPLIAKLANRWITEEELEGAIERNAKVQIDFEQGHPLKPVIRDIFYSLCDLAAPIEKSSLKQSLAIEAEEIVLTGRQRVVIRSGETKIIFDGQTGEITMEGRKIDATASKTHRIKGASILVN